MPTRNLLNALPQDRRYQIAIDIPMMTGRNAISFTDWTEAQGFMPAPDNQRTLFCQPALQRQPYRLFAKLKYRSSEIVQHERSAMQSHTLHDYQHGDRRSRSRRR